MSYRVLAFDLSVDRRGDAAERVPIGERRILQVLTVPATASNVRFKAEEGADFIPAIAGRRIEACPEPFGKLILQNDPTSGTLEVYVGTDPIPFDSGGGAAALAADLLPVLHTVWPGGGTILAPGAAFATNGRTRWGGAVANMWAANDGAAGSAMDVYKGLLCGTFTMGGGAFSGRVLNEGSMNPLLVRPAAAGFRSPRTVRVWRTRLLLAAPAAVNWTLNTGVALLLGAGAAPGWIALGNRGVGIAGDGAGGWRFVSKRTAGAPGTVDESVPLTWPDAPTEWVDVAFDVFAASGAAEARFQLSLNNVPAISRSWGPGTLLPTYADLVNGSRLVPYVRAGDAVGELVVAAAEVYVGPCDVLGIEAP